jgi:hypothetical protein
MNAPRTRVQRRPVHGVLLLDKPYGMSSNDALQKAKPASSKGIYLRKVAVSSTMGVGIRVDTNSLSA